MTMIIAAITPDAVILAADGRRSAGDGTVSQVRKLRPVAERTVLAKGGFGDLADPIWDAVADLPAEIRNDPVALADRVATLGADIHAVCMAAAVAAGSADLGLYLFVAGIGADGRAVLVIVDAGRGQRREYRCDGATEVTGMGSIPGVPEIARAAAATVSKPGQSLPVIEWATEAIRLGAAADPGGIAFPGELAVVSATDVQSIVLPA